MVNDYISYFRNLAIKHIRIAHNPQSDHPTDPSGEKHFTRISIEEVVTGLTETVFFPLLSLELYETTTKSESVFDVKTATSGAFMVLDHPPTNAFSDIQTAYETTELITLQLLQKIWQDHYGPDANMCDRPFRQFDFSNVEITPVGPVFGGEYGYRTTFHFELQDAFSITTPPEAGIFKNNG